MLTRPNGLTLVWMFFGNLLMTGRLDRLISIERKEYLKIPSPLCIALGHASFFQREFFPTQVKTCGRNQPRSSGFSPPRRRRAPSPRWRKALETRFYCNLVWNTDGWRLICYRMSLSCHGEKLACALWVTVDAIAVKIIRARSPSDGASISHTSLWSQPFPE